MFQISGHYQNGVSYLREMVYTECVSSFINSSHQTTTNQKTNKSTNT